MNPTYRRLLIKLSGEQLAGDFEGGLDAKLITWIASEIKVAAEINAQIVLMVGGGNFVRGAQISGNGISRVTGDYMGMLSTMINGLAVTDLFNEAGLESRLLTNIKADQVADHFTVRRALSHLKKGRVVILAGGTSQPYLTTDTAAVSFALQLDCDIVCKLTKVDGVYEKDPIKFPEAKKFDTLTFQQAVESPGIMVIDKAAMGLAMEQNMPIAVFALHEPGSLRRFVFGEHLGTIIK